MAHSCARASLHAELRGHEPRNGRAFRRTHFAYRMHPHWCQPQVPLASRIAEHSDAAAPVASVVYPRIRRCDVPVRPVEHADGFSSGAELDPGANRHFGHPIPTKPLHPRKSHWRDWCKRRIEAQCCHYGCWLDLCEAGDPLTGVAGRSIPAAPAMRPHTGYLHECLQQRPPFRRLSQYSHPRDGGMTTRARGRRG